MCFKAIYQATLRSGRVSSPVPPISVLAALLYFGTTSAAVPPPQNVTIGVLNYLGPEKTVGHWAATVETLNQALPDVRFRLAPLDHAGMRAALTADDLEFVITNPGNYAELEYAFHISRIATTEENTPVASTLVTTHSELNALTDLSGRRLAAVSEDAFGGFQVIWRELQDAGLRPGHNLDMLMTGLPMQKVADAVLSGQADAGVLRACMLEEMQAADPTRYGALRAFGVRSTQNSYSVGAPALSRIVATNPVIVGQAMAETLDIATGDKVRLSTPGGSLESVAVVRDGVSPGTVAIEHGYGHRAFGAADITIDNKTVPGDPGLASGVLLNDLGMLDPTRSNAGVWVDPISGTAVRNGLPARIEKIA